MSEELSYGTLYRNTISDGVRRAAVKFRDRPALTFAGRSWSFAEVERASGRIARHLALLGLSKGDCVGAYARNSDAYLLFWLGCLRAGLVHVPINYALTAGELRYILDQSGAKALFHDPDVMETVNTVRMQTAVDHYGLLRGGDGDILSTAIDVNAQRIEEPYVTRRTSRNSYIRLARRRRRKAQPWRTAP
jgi:fatty-acyl-CoA synthase